MHIVRLTTHSDTASLRGRFAGFVVGVVIEFVAAPETDTLSVLSFATDAASLLEQNNEIHLSNHQKNSAMQWP